MNQNGQLQRILDGLSAAVRQARTEHAALKSKLDLLEQMAIGRRSITSEIDAIPGRRLWYNLVGRIRFTAADEGRRGLPISMFVSQDGPFIHTHYPIAMWLPSEPATATMLGLWRPVTPWPLPLQFTQAPVDGDTDVISISYEVVDAGSQRNFQNEPVPPLLSRPDNIVPLPCPSLYTPNTTMQFIPTYQRILFNNDTVPPTAGVLVCAFPGYRVVNM
jgi:hypothetical protein